MDVMALTVANRCVGNDPYAAGFEFTLTGPTIEFSKDTVIALTGAAVDAVLEPSHRSVPTYQAFLAEAGSVLTIGQTIGGARGYLAVQGGVDVPLVLGSRSTNIRAQLGGLDGRALRAGDTIHILPKLQMGPLMRWQGDKNIKGTNPLIVRVFPGSQADFFAAEDLERFFEQDYYLRPDSDRMGLRLRGIALEDRGPKDIASEPSFPGQIQIASGGLPIILGRDLPVTGGYAKIATIFAADFGELAYLLPGQKVRFSPSTLENSKVAWIEALKSIEARFEEL